MNGKKGLSRIMSALLAASSMIGGASAAPKIRSRPSGMVLGSKNDRGRRDGKKELVPLSNKSGVVNWIKSHPKTSLGVGIGIGAIGGYVCYKVYDSVCDSVCDSELNKMCRKMFNEENFGDFYALDWCVPEVISCIPFNYFRFGKLVDVGDGRKCKVNFALRRECFYDEYEDFDVAEDSLLDSCLRLVIFAYFCKRMVEVHPEWEHLLVDESGEGKEIDVVAGVNYGDLIGWFDAEKVKYPEHGQVSSDLLKAKVWARFLSEFYKKYFGKLKAHLKNYGEVNKLSLKDKLRQKAEAVLAQEYKSGKELR